MADFMEMLNPQGQGQAQPQGQALPPGAPIEGPPTSNEEMIARKSGWGQFFDTVRTNPGLQQAMMFMAAKMMQPLQQGETVAGSVGQGMFGASTLLGSGQDAERERQLKEQEGLRRNELASAQSEQARAHAGAFRQQTAESAQKAPLEIERLRYESKKAQLELALKNLDLAVAQGLTTEEQVKFKRDKLQAELDNIKANAVQSLAAAGASSASAAWTRERAQTERETRPWEVSTKASGALEAQNKSNLSGMDVEAAARGEPPRGARSGGSTAAVVQGRNDLYDRLASIHKDWRPDQINAEILRAERVGKGKPDRQFLIDAQKVYNDAKLADPYGTPPIEEWYERTFGEPWPGGKSAPNASSTETSFGQVQRWGRDANGKPVPLR